MILSNDIVGLGKVKKKTMNYKSGVVSTTLMLAISTVEIEGIKLRKGGCD